MIKIGKKNLLIVSFLSVILLCGAVSASNINFSQDGKILTIKPDIVKSTLKTMVTPSNNGIFGKGKYLTMHVTGKDNKGRTNYDLIQFFNNDVIKSDLLYVKGSHFIKYSISYGINRALIKICANLDYNITSTGKGTYEVKRINGKQMINNGLVSLTYSQNGKLFAICKVTSRYTHKFLNGNCYDDKITTITKTTYLNGDIRTAIIDTVFLRNSNGNLIGKKISGKSYGTDKINNSTARYTGKIYVGTRYDPNDWLNSNYNVGDYKEVRTSSSPTLLKRVPLDAL